MKAVANDLAGRVAIVTGAGRGLGRAMAEALAYAVCRVVATAARTPTEIETLASNFPGRIVSVVAMSLCLGIACRALRRRCPVSAGSISW